MFFLLAILATVFYALNNIFLAPLVRNLNSLLVNSYRGLALGLTMTPMVLFFVKLEDLQNINSNLAVLIILASTVTVLGNVSFYKAQNYLPVGIASPVCMGFSSIIALIIGDYYLNENVSSSQIFLSFLIVLEVFVMGLVSRSSSFKGLNVKKGLAYCFLFGLFLGSGFSLVGIISKSINPILTGYLWEFCVGIIGIIFYLALNKFKNINTKDFFKVGLASSPTVFGTSAYAVATTLGPIGILAAILTTIGIMTAILGHFFLKEKLSLKQWVLVLVLAVSLIFLKLSF